MHQFNHQELVPARLEELRQGIKHSRRAGATNRSQRSRRRWARWSTETRPAVADTSRRGAPGSGPDESDLDSKTGSDRGC